VSEITVDTNVVVFAIEDGEVNACAFLYECVTKNVLVLDHEQEIDKEYRGRFKGSMHNKRFEKWWMQVSARADRHVRYTNKVMAEDRQEFVRVRFSEKDWKFAGVCIRSADKILVSEDTDFDCVRQYLEKKRGVSIKNINQILVEHRGAA